MSLFLKYRPRNFAEVIGQDHIVTTLEHSAERNQLVHAYLLYGSRGTGKTSVARILAKILLIQGIEDDKIQQQIIRAVDEGSLVDLIEIDAATNRLIEDVRELKEKVQFSPTVASAKVYIIDEVHMMTKEAFNALLKTLEEPPDYAYFILATTELHKVPDTIQSRCQRFPFRRLGEEDIIRGLQNIADSEHISVERDALRAIAHHVNGGMRDAISLLDQLSSLEKITVTDVRERIGQSGQEYVEEVWQAVEGDDIATLLTVTASLQENGVALDIFMRQLLAHARKGLHEAVEKKKNIGELLRRIDVILDALKNIRTAPVPVVVLETALIGLCSEESIGIPQAKDNKKEAVKKAKEKLENKNESAFASSTADRERKVNSEPAFASGTMAGRERKDAEESEKDIEKKDAVIEAKEITVESLQEGWKEILISIKTPSVRMSLKDASIKEIKDGILILVFSSNFHRDKVAGTVSMTEIAQAIENHFHANIRIECVLGGAENVGDVSKSQQGNEVNIAEAIGEVFG